MIALPASELEPRILARAHAANASVTPEQVAQLAAYYRLLERWNQKINLTSLLPAVGDGVDRSIDKLLIEPLAAVDELGEALGATPIWVDFGTGGGSPAVPLKILRPQCSLTMVEARERKTAFLREAVSTLRLSDARALAIRIESLSDGHLRGVVDVITTRAVKLDAGIMASAAALLKPGGRLVVFANDMSLAFNELVFKKIREIVLPPGAGRLLVFHVER